ncbi:MAG: M28 family peptidase, partial [Flavobacteriales bacterium]
TDLFVKKIVQGESPGKKEIAKPLLFHMERKTSNYNASNVLAFISGSDPVKKDEVVVLSAHYDHVGVIKGEIHNGADDDGSGTVMLMELARVFQKAKDEGNGPARSLLFLHVSGEEKGLLGSEWYADHPILPLEKTICNLNVDMIGRKDVDHKDANYVYLIGSDKLSSRLHQISEEANTKYTQLQLDYTYNDPNDPNRFYYRSDHYNFAKKGIPVIFYFSGVHEDYHKPGDDPEKIMYGKMSRIGKLIFHTAWEAANIDGGLPVDSNKE